LQHYLEDYTFENFPILSPKILSLFPEDEGTAMSGEGEAHKLRPNLLSPNLFSFHDSGAFSLPTLLKLVSSDEAELHSLLDALIEASGADKVLDRLIKEIEPKSADLENNLYPSKKLSIVVSVCPKLNYKSRFLLAVQKLQRLEEKLRDIKNASSYRQGGGRATYLHIYRFPALFSA